MQTLSIPTELFLNLMWGNHDFPISPVWRKVIAKDRLAFVVRVPIKLGREIEEQYAETKGKILIQHDEDNALSVVWYWPHWIESNQLKEQRAFEAKAARDALLAINLHRTRYELMSKRIAEVFTIKVQDVARHLDITYNVQGEEGVQAMVSNYEKMATQKFYLPPTQTEIQQDKSTHEHTNQNTEAAQLVSPQVAEEQRQEELDPSADRLAVDQDAGAAPEVGRDTYAEEAPRSGEGDEESPATTD